MAHGHSRGAAGEDRTRDNRRSTNNRRNNRNCDNRRHEDERERSQANSRAQDDERTRDPGNHPNDDEESLERVQVRVSAETLRRIKEIVRGHGVMPRNATYDEWLCYQKLLFHRQEFLRKEAEDLQRRKEAADASSIRRAQLSSMRSSQSRNTVTGRSKSQSRLTRLSAQDLEELPRNMTDIGVDPTGLAPKTPEAGLQAAAAYLLANPPKANTPLAAGYTNALTGLGIAQSLLPNNPNPQPGAPRQNRASPQRGQPAVRRGSPRQDAPVLEARNNITQGRVDRARDERALRDEDNEAFGLDCFSEAIRQAAIPEKFKLPNEPNKYDGVQDPKAWIEDYLATIKLNNGTRDTAMQFIQLHLKEPARAWLRNLPEESITHWNDLQRLFIANFKATCKRPNSIEELRRCQQRGNESLRDYINRWTKIKNTCENLNQELVIDAFKRGLLRRDLREELGRMKPKTLSALMELVSNWADGEDSVQRPRGDAHDDDDEPQGSRFTRKRKNIDTRYFGSSNQIAATHPRKSFREPGPSRQYGSSFDNRGPRPRRDWQPEKDDATASAEDLAAPCDVHSFLDKDGIRRSSHLLRDCRTFQRRVEEYTRQQMAAGANHTIPPPIPGAVAYGAPPPPPIPPPVPNVAAAVHHVPPPPQPNPGVQEAYPPSKGVMNMIQKGPPSKKAQKLITRQVALTYISPPATPEYLDGSEVPITFDREDHPMRVPRPGHSPLVLDAQIGGFDMSRVFMDGGSGLNILFAATVRKMNISLDNLEPTETTFHSVEPGKPIVPMGKLHLDVVFGKPDNFRREKLEFEVVDWPSQYHAILGRPAYGRFLMVPHYAYLKMKIPGKDGRVITVHGDFARADKCDRDFHKIAESFGMQKEFQELKETANYSELPIMQRNQPNHEFDVGNTKSVQVHPTDPSKTAMISSTLDRA